LRPASMPRLAGMINDAGQPLRLGGLQYYKPDL
jgi:hypothetical protein